MNIWRSLLVCLPLAFFAHAAQAIQIYELEGIVTRAERTTMGVTVPIDIGQSFTGTLMYHPEISEDAGFPCTINAFSFSLNIESVSIQSGTNSVFACLEELPFIYDYDGPTSNFPGDWYRELSWTDIATDSAYPQYIPASAFVHSRWLMLWLAKSFEEEVRVTGLVTKVSEVPEPRPVLLFATAFIISLAYRRRRESEVNRWVV